ncbi:hypothetical protein, partial [Microbacterium gallinarum]|uniref:hypothetical protein n=1 Tax=Microbacterium gallinarum TaxID=2762209 RepID=UPI001CD8BA5C
KHFTPPQKSRHDQHTRTVRETGSGSVVLAAPRLPRWLQSRVAVLRADEVAELSRIAAASATWGHPNIPAADLAAFAELRNTVTAARNRRRSWALALVLSPLAMLATLTVGMLSLFR